MEKEKKKNGDKFDMLSFKEGMLDVQSTDVYRTI